MPADAKTDPAPEPNSMATLTLTPAKQLIAFRDQPPLVKAKIMEAVKAQTLQEIRARLIELRAMTAKKKRSAAAPAPAPAPIRAPASDTAKTPAPPPAVDLDDDDDDDDDPPAASRAPRKR